MVRKYRKTSHSKYELKVHLIWVTKYRYKVLVAVPYGDNITKRVEDLRKTELFTSLRQKTSKFSPVIKFIFNFYLKMSVVGKVLTKSASYMTGFDEQRLNIIRSLNPLPKIEGTTLSIAALAANVGYLTFPLLSKLWVLSGFTPGYAVGLYIMRENQWQWLSSEAYSQALNSQTL